VRRLILLAAILILSCALEARAQMLQLELAGPRNECRTSWVFGAGSVEAQFSAGKLSGQLTQPPRFEVATFGEPFCGGSSLFISFNSWVKNVRIRVNSGAWVVRVSGALGGSVNPGGAIATIAGPTSGIFLDSTGDAGFTVEMISFELAEQPALFSFAATTTGRVLTHKYGSDDTYPSAMQIEDSKIRVEGLIHDLSGTTGIAGRTVHFRLIDPPDTADYVIQANDAHTDDNVDGPGTLNGSSTASAVSDSAGKVSVTLAITDHAAGDNYQIEASLDPEFKCSTSPCQKSIVYTAWKRVYVEVNKMYRRSAFLTKKVVPGAKILEVSDVRPFPNPPFDVILVHGPAPGSASSAFSRETVRIVSKTSVPFFNFNAVPGELDLDPDPEIPGVSGAYDGPAGPDSAGNPRDFLADTVAFVTGDRTKDFYLIRGQLVNEEFKKAFVEHVWLTDAGVSDPDLLPDQPRLAHDGVVPYVQLMNKTNVSQWEWMTRKWSHHVARAGISVIAKPNHHIVFTASRRFEPNLQETLYAATTVAGGSNDLWLYLDRIPAGVEPEAIVHELAHEWHVNPSFGTTISGGHCDAALGGDQMMALHPSAKCTMTSNMYSESSASDGVVGFHYWKPPGGGPVHSEYMHIRHRSEPIPQNELVRPEPPQ